MSSGRRYLLAKFSAISRLFYLNETQFYKQNKTKQNKITDTGKEKKKHKEQ